MTKKQRITLMVLIVISPQWGMFHLYEAITKTSTDWITLFLAICLSLVAIVFVEDL